MQRARTDKPARTKLLTRYRRLVVTPILRDYDDKAFKAVAVKMHWPYLMFQPNLIPCPDSLLNPNWDRTVWKCYRPWAVVRALGKVPLQVFEAGDLPLYMEHCPLCGAPLADMAHLLCICPGTRDLFGQWLVDTREPETEISWPKLQEKLFSDWMAREKDSAFAAARIIFVGSVCRRVASHLGHEVHTERSVDSYIQLAVEEARQALIEP